MPSSKDDTPPDAEKASTSKPSKPGSSAAEPMEEESPAPGPSGASGDLGRVVLDVTDDEAEGREDDEFGLVEAALSQGFRPVLRRCDEVLQETGPVQVSTITSEQRRALGRVDTEGATPRAEIVTDFVKLEVEEHEVEEDPVDADPTWTISETHGSTPAPTPSTSTSTKTASDSGYGKPYKTTSSDRRSRGRGVRLAISPGFLSPRGRGAVGGRGRVWLPRGRGAPAGARPSPASAKPSPASAKPSPASAKPSPASAKPTAASPPSSRGRGARGRGRGGRGRGRGRGVIHLQAGRTQTPGKSSLAAPIEVIRIPERKIRVVVVRDRLVLQKTDENDTDPCPTHGALTFMELVKIKEALTKLLEKCNREGPDEHVPRLRAARRISFSWVETRLRAEAQGDILSTHGKMGKSKYDALPGPPTPPTQTARSATASDSPRGRGRAILPKPTNAVKLTGVKITPGGLKAGPGGVRITPGGLKITPVKGTPAGARQATLPGQTPVVDDADDPDYDPTVDENFDSERARKQKAAKTAPTPVAAPAAPVQPATLPSSQFGAARLVNINTQVKNPKSSRDIVILQAKLRDLQNVGAELRRAVDYFSVEASKDKSKISRLKNEGVVLEKKLKDLEASIMGNSPSILISLLDKEKRKALAAHDDAVMECGELFGEVGNTNYKFVVAQGVPLLSAKELEEKTRGVTMNWQLDQAELVAAAAPLPATTGRARAKKRKRAAMDAGAAVDAAVEAVVAGAGGVGAGGPAQTTVGSADGSEHISLPQEVLEQVMNGKGYLVDENGERLEIRVLGDQVHTQ